MKNKKGFTLVELLAVIVILALIMGIAIVSIGNVVQESRQNVMFENAQGVIDAIKTTFAIKFETPNGSYGFDSTILGDRGIKSPMGGNFIFGSKGDGDTLITTGLWKLGTAPSGCTATSTAYVTVTNGKYTLCMAAGTGNKYIDGPEDKISQNDSSVIKG